LANREWIHSKSCRLNKDQWEISAKFQAGRFLHEFKTLGQRPRTIPEGYGLRKYVEAKRPRLVLEHDFNLKAWEYTTELCKFNKKPKMVKKIITAIYEEGCKYFDIAKFPSDDTSNWAPMKRVQEVSQSVQRRVVAAETQIKEELENLLEQIPRNSNDIRQMEIDMRDLVHLYERATKSSLGSTEDTFCEKLIRRLILQLLIMRMRRREVMW
jgi:hypothetical protein